PTIPGVGLGNAFAVAPNVPTSGSWLPYGGFGAPYAPAPPPGISPATVAGAQLQVPQGGGFETPAERVAGGFGPYAPGAEYVPPTFPATTIAPPGETRDERNARLTSEIASQFERAPQLAAVAPTPDEYQTGGRIAAPAYAPAAAPVDRYLAG